MEEDRLCVTCARPIPKKKSRAAIRCSKACANIYYRMRREGEYGPAKPYFEVACLHCGEPIFRGSYANKVYCGDKCRQLFLRREWGYRKYFDYILERDEGVCYLCQLPVVPDGKAPLRPSVDHLIPVRPHEDVLSGGDEPVNLGLAHVGCNGQKRNHIIEEAISKLKENIERKEDGYEKYPEEILREAELWVRTISFNSGARSSV